MREKPAGTAGAGKRIRCIMAVAVVAAVCLFAALSYINHYYEATELAKQAMKGSSSVEVAEYEDYYRFVPSEEVRSGDGIIFYPGGKVEESAYAPLMLLLAECGYEVYLMRMPARLAVLKPNAAELVIGGAGESGVPDSGNGQIGESGKPDSENGQIGESGVPDSGAGQIGESGVPDSGAGQAGASGVGERRWILMGHSLGGAMAAGYAGKHSGQVSALVLLAAYSTADLSDTGIQVFSFYGSEDGVMNREKYEKYRANLPEDLYELVIDGGNHAGFAFYGEQKGDGAASISREEQQETVVDALRSYLENP